MASILKRGDSYSVRYKYKDHSGKPCEGWESFKTKKEAQERKITVEKELLDGTFLVPDTMTVEEMLYKWIPIQSTKHKWSPKTYTQSVAMVQNLIVPYCDCPFRSFRPFFFVTSQLFRGIRLDAQFLGFFDCTVHKMSKFL